MRTIIAVLLSVAIGTLPAQAELWSGILSPTRGIDWSDAGVKGDIPNRTTICQTLNPAATAAQINSAIATCPSGQVVKLNAGTYNLSSGITFNGKNNVTLRGAGPDATFLIFSGTVGCVYDTLICVVSSSSINPQPPSQSTNWTAGYTKGSTSVTLASVTGLRVGQIMYLDQRNDGATDTFPEIWMCATGGQCAIEGDSGIDRGGRAQVQAVEVMSISGSGPYTVGISPGLYMPNWRSGQNPQAWWMNGDATGVGDGIEDLSVANNGSQSGSNISFGNARDGWIKNVRSLYGERSHVLLYGALRITIRDSYFFGTLNATTRSYGIETNLSSSFLVENNISHHLTSFMTMGQAAEGSVWGYNFSIDSYYCAPGGGPADWMQGSSYHHTAGIDYTLFEGNDGTGFIADAIHGTAHFMTAFRNHWQGYDPKGCSSNGKLQQTIPVHIYAFNRYFNIIGNVLGDPRRPHTTYENFVSSATSPTSAPNPDVSIYMLGFSGNQEKAGAGYDFAVNNDVNVRNTLMRWGNYDLVSRAVRYQASEVPSSLVLYSNSVPATQSLPSSFYLLSKPSWYGSVTWPSIGPDVSGVVGPGNKVIKIPARVCFESVMGGIGMESAPLSFNANKCYIGGSGGAETLPPSSPTNLRVS